MNAKILQSGVGGKICLILALWLTGCSLTAQDNKSATVPDGLSIEKSNFGKMPDSREVELYTLTNRHGMVCKIMTLGCIITEVDVPDRNGKSADVVLGFDNFASYLKGHPLFGAVVGRVVNRIANGQFMLDGKTYQLPRNNGSNSIHGGLRGFDKVLWQATPIEHANQVSLRLAYTSRDGEEGYPGEMKVAVTYTLSNDNELRLEYEATSDKPTPINLSNHTYWNLAGGGNVSGHLLTLMADEFTPTDAALIPTGEFKSVKGTPVDFTMETAIGTRLDALTNPPAHFYDHNFVLRTKGPALRLAAHVYEPTSGRVLDVSTTQPAVQLYTGYRGKLPNRDGADFTGGLCLETQHFPDFVNHANFPQSILRPGETYRQSVVWKFSTK